MRGRERRHARTRHLDETTDDISLPQQLRHREGEVHARDRITKLAREPELDHGGNEHRYGLTEGGGLSFDAADAPAENAQAVRGRRVGVGSHKRVKANDVSCGHRVGCDDLAEALYVELVADATSWGDDLDVLKRPARPFEKGEALGITSGLELLVGDVAILLARTVRSDRVINNERTGDVRVHLGGVSPSCDHGVPHRGEVHKDGDAREVLEERAGRHELDLSSLPTAKARVHDLPRKADGVLVGSGAPHAVLEQHHEGVWESLDARDVAHVNVVPSPALGLEDLGVAGRSDGGPKRFS